MITGDYEDAEGRLCVDEVGAIDHWSGGIPFAASGGVAVSRGAVTQRTNGLVFDADNRLCIAYGGTIARSMNGLTLTSGDGICLAVSSTAHNRGLGRLSFDSTGKIRTTLFFTRVRETAKVGDRVGVAKG